MREPFPVLTYLHIIQVAAGGIVPVLPVEFLGGSAPRLRTINLKGIPYPTMPTLLLSASDLTELRLFSIPLTGYISPEAMVVGLAALPRLKIFDFHFQSALPRPDRIPLPPITQIVLPALTYFNFTGASEYLEDFVARIDTPQLDWVRVVLFNQLADIQATQLSQFVARSIGSASKRAEVTFSSGNATFTLDPQSCDLPSVRPLASTVIRCEGIDWQVSHLAQTLSQFKSSATLSNLVHLKLKLNLETDRQLEGTDDIDWQHFLRPFSNVKMLHVSKRLAVHIALSLEDIAVGMAAEVLPSVELIWLGGRRVRKFVTARRLSGRPVTVVGTKRELYEKFKSFVEK